MTFALAILCVLTAISATNRVYIDDFEIDPDSLVTVPVVLANEDSTRGFQFDMIVPLGLSVESYQLTPYSLEFDMSASCRWNEGNIYVVFIYPPGPICFPADTMAVLNLTFAAESNFRGGNIILNNAWGSMIDSSRSFKIGGDTVAVTVPTSSLIGIPVDQQPVDEHYFNMMGQPIMSPADAAVAIKVVSLPDGRYDSSKVAVVH